MTTRVPGYVFGPRGPDHGVFVAPPGVNALTAPLDELILAITTKAVQVTMRGVVAPSFPKTISHGLSFRPFIFPNLVSTDLVGGFGYVRPFDNSYPPYTLTSADITTTGFTVNQSGTGSALNVYYAVLNKELPL